MTLKDCLVYLAFCVQIKGCTKSPIIWLIRLFCHFILSHYRSGSLFNAEVAHRDSPRPSSVDSNQSTHSSLNLSIHGQGKGDSGICVGEELRIAVSIALERFRLSEEQKGWPITYIACVNM